MLGQKSSSFHNYPFACSLDTRLTTKSHSRGWLKARQTLIPEYCPPEQTDSKYFTLKIFTSFLSLLLPLLSSFSRSLLFLRSFLPFSSLLTVITITTMHIINIFSLVVWAVKSRALFMLGRQSTTELHSHISNSFSCF